MKLKDILLHKKGNITIVIVAFIIAVSIVSGSANPAGGFMFFFPAAWALLWMKCMFIAGLFWFINAACEAIKKEVKEVIVDANTEIKKGEN